MGYRKMTLIPTRNAEGIVYLCECYYCKTKMTPEQADTHTCEENS